MKGWEVYGEALLQCEPLRNLSLSFCVEVKRDLKARLRPFCQKTARAAFHEVRLPQHDLHQNEISSDGERHRLACFLDLYSGSLILVLVHRQWLAFHLMSLFELGNLFGRLGLLWPLSPKFVLRRLLLSPPFMMNHSLMKASCLGLWEANSKDFIRSLVNLILQSSILQIHRRSISMMRMRRKRSYF